MAISRAFFFPYTLLYKRPRAVGMNISSSARPMSDGGPMTIYSRVQVRERTENQNGISPADRAVENMARDNLLSIEHDNEKVQCPNP